MKLFSVVMILALSASTLTAAPAQKRIPTLKVGKCAITLLDSNGIKPLSGADLLLTNAEDGKAVVSAVANKSGLCEITVAEGRYLLSINQKPITMINAAKNGELAWARIVVSETPMLVGGAEGATAVTTFTLLGVEYSTYAAAVAAAVAAGVGVNAIVQNNEGGLENNNNNNQNNQQDQGGTPSGTSR